MPPDSASNWFDDSPHHEYRPLEEPYNRPGPESDMAIVVSGHLAHEGYEIRTAVVAIPQLNIINKIHWASDGSVGICPRKAEGKCLTLTLTKSLMLKRENALLGKWLAG